MNIDDKYAPHSVYIRTVRKALGLGQQGFAEMVMLTKQAISAYETGRQTPCMRTIHIATRALMARGIETVLRTHGVPVLNRAAFAVRARHLFHDRLSMLAGYYGPDAVIDAARYISDDSPWYFGLDTSFPMAGGPPYLPLSDLARYCSVIGVIPDVLQEAVTAHGWDPLPWVDVNDSCGGSVEE